MAKEQQTERTAMRFTPTEARMLEELSELTGMTKTDIVRQAIRREYADRIGEAPKATRKPKRK
jgi:hypothetical protein